MATHSSILAWKIPWTEEPSGLQSMGSQRVEHNWACACTHTHTHTHTCAYRMTFFCKGNISFSENKGQYIYNARCFPLAFSFFPAYPSFQPIYSYRSSLFSVGSSPLYQNHQKNLHLASVRKNSTSHICFLVVIRTAQDRRGWGRGRFPVSECGWGNLASWSGKLPLASLFL